MPNEYEVKVTVGDAQIDVRGAKDGVVEIVQALSAILAARAPAPDSPQATPPPTETRPTRGRRHVDARSFFQEKAPSSQSEAIAVAAYYLSELAPPDMESTTIDTEKALEVFRQAKFPLPKRTAQVLVNAQNAGYLARVGSGEYKLNPVGFNLVEHTLGPNA
jgi:hypothetical protein